MKIHHVAVLYLVTQFGEPHGVAARSASDVRYDCGWGWQPSQDDLLGTHELQDPLGGCEPVALVALVVVGFHLGVRVFHTIDSA